MAGAIIEFAVGLELIAVTTLAEATYTGASSGARQRYMQLAS